MAGRKFLDYAVIVGVAALSISGCRQEELYDGGELVEKGFYASYDSPAKTSLNEDCSVDWCAGDTIFYYSAANGTVGQHVMSEACHSAHITAKVGENDSFFIAAYGGKSISGNTGKALTMSGAVNAEQTGAFDDAHVSIAKVYLEEGQNDYTLPFSNVTSLVKFSFERTDVGYVVFTATDGTKIHGNGELKFTFSGETASAAFGDGGGSSIKVNAVGTGTFYMATLPCTITGFDIKVYTSAGECIGVVSSTKTLSLAKDKVVNLGVLDSRIQEIPPTDLSASGTANCYIVSAPGKYTFKANVKGNSTTALDGTPYKAEVLWESFGTSITPTVGDIVSNAKYKDGYITFTSGKDGNAVIAVKDRDDEILWSWHIWVCEGFDADACAQVYNNNAGTMMDRNLGATSATPGDVEALGLLYQWGRKDPFLGSSSISSSVTASSTITWPAIIASNTSSGTIAYATAHPTTFIANSASNYDWYYTGSPSTDDTRWSSSKSIYDPCPPGYRVPDGGSNGVWAIGLGQSSSWSTSANWDSTNMGMDFGSTDRTLGSGSVWYPATGSFGYSDGIIYTVGSRGGFWSCTPNDYKAYYLYFDGNNGFVNPSNSNYRASCRAVRCLSESSPAIVPVTSVSLDKTTASIVEGSTLQLTATVVPDNANVKAVTWTSSNSSVATVSSSGLVAAKTAGTCTITVSSYNGISATCSITVNPAATDLSSGGTANCYIVSSAGTYKFKTVKGNSSTSVGTVASAAVLWETFGTSTVPSVGDLVNTVSYANGYITFKATSKKGNAVIAAKNSSGTILWSWHIWMTDKPVDQVYNNNAGTMMDRNLGATSASKGSVKSLGLLYQWGRKDPFLGSSSISSSTFAKSSINWPSAVSSSSSTGTIAYTIAHPTTFITYNSNNNDWQYSGSSSRDQTRWSSSKGLYDPCPYGYRVPSGGSSGIWAKAIGNGSGHNSGPWDSTNYGMNFSTSSTSSYAFGTDSIIWYPASGEISGTTGSFETSMKNSGHYWTSSYYSGNSTVYNLYFYSDGYFWPTGYGDKNATGMSVRCQKM